MALTINRGEKPAAAMVSDRRLYLTADKSEVVEDGDPRAAFLFANEGYELSAAIVERYGLTAADGKVVLSGATAPEPRNHEEEVGGDSDEGEATPELPADIPGHDELVAANLTTIEAVAAHEDLTEIDGIGKATAARIAEYLADFQDGDSDEGDAGES